MVLCRVRDSVTFVRDDKSHCTWRMIAHGSDYRDAFSVFRDMIIDQVFFFSVIFLTLRSVSWVAWRLHRCIRIYRFRAIHLIFVHFIVCELLFKLEKRIKKHFSLLKYKKYIGDFFSLRCDFFLWILPLQIEYKEGLNTEFVDFWYRLLALHSEIKDPTYSTVSYFILLDLLP